MTVIRNNSISGINSITAQSASLNFYDTSGNTLSIGASVTGNVTGDLSGNVTGNLTGDVTTGVGGSITVGNSIITSTAISIGATDTTGRNAGVGTAAGTMIYNTSPLQLEVFNPNGTWTSASTQPFSATGGTIDSSTRPGYNVHTFTGDGSFEILNGTSPTDVEYLVIAGGGGGGGYGGGGGGAGGYLTGTLSQLTPGIYSIQVGGGGIFVAPPNTNSTQGTPSYITNPGISSITSIGGGRGGSYNSPYAPPSAG